MALLFGPTMRSVSICPVGTFPSQKPRTAPPAPAFSAMLSCHCVRLPLTEAYCAAPRPSLPTLEEVVRYISQSVQLDSPMNPPLNFSPLKVPPYALQFVQFTMAMATRNDEPGSTGVVSASATKFAPWKLNTSLVNPVIFMPAAPIEYVTPS